MGRYSERASFEGLGCWPRHWHLRHSQGELAAIGRKLSERPKKTLG